VVAKYEVMYLMCILLTIGIWDSFVYILGGRGVLGLLGLTLLGYGVILFPFNLL